MGADVKIVVLESEDLLKFRDLFYDELLLTLPDDAMILGAIDASGQQPEAVGLLIFHIRERSAYVDWLYVSEEHRHQGIGRALVDDLKHILRIDPEESTDFVFLEFDETIEGMGRFLRNNEFAVTFYDGNFNIYAPLKSVRLMAENKKVTDRLKAVPLDQVPPAVFSKFDDYIGLVENEYIGVVGPIEPSQYRPESRAILDGDRIVGIMLVGDTIYKNNVIIDWVYSIPKYVLEAVPLAFDTVISELKRSLSDDTMISMASLAENVGAIIRKTMPGAVFTEAYSSFWLVER